MKKLQPSRLWELCFVLFFILNTKTHKILAFVSAQHMSSYLEPWQSLLTIQGSQNMLAASLIFENSVNLTFFLAINMLFNSYLFFSQGCQCNANRHLHRYVWKRWRVMITNHSLLFNATFFTSAVRKKTWVTGRLYALFSGRWHWNGPQ